MCGRLRTSEDWSEIGVRPKLLPFFRDLLGAPDPDVRPSTVRTALVNTSPWTLAPLRWGLLPTWAKTDTRPQINARSETAFEKPFWRDAIRHRRCVIGATGYYEWSGHPGHKVKHLFERRDHSPLALAGIWTPPRAAGEPGTFALMTCEPNALARAVHDRMPVILETDAALERWLSPTDLGPDEGAKLLVPASEELLVATPPAAVGSGQGSLF